MSLTHPIILTRSIYCLLHFRHLIHDLPYLLIFLILIFLVKKMLKYSIETRKCNEFFISLGSRHEEVRS